MKVKAIAALNELHDQEFINKDEKEDIEKSFEEWMKGIIPFVGTNEPNLNDLDIESGEVVGSN